jgi:uncharacterized protein (UPF0261 family)
VTKSVLIIATLDTKGPEAAYIRDGLNRLGIKTTVIDTGILGEPLGIVPDISHEELAAVGGLTLQELQNSGTRGRAVERHYESEGVIRCRYRPRRHRDWWR